MNAEHPFLIEADAKAAQPAILEWFKKRRWFLLFVIGPTLLSAFYYAFIASDIYISESRFVIKSPSQKQSQMPSLASLIQTSGLSSGGQEQSNEVLSYIQSRDALKALEQGIGLRDRFARSQADGLSRFPQPFHDNSFEGLYKYYGRMIDAHLDSETGLAIITVRAFTAQDAYAINEHLLELSEGLVNRLNTRSQNRAISEAQKQVDVAMTRAKQARQTLSQYRNSKALIDPAAQANGVLQIANGLTSQRAALQAQLDQMQRVTPSNPGVAALRVRIAAVDRQIASQDSRVVGSSSGIASKIGGYENLMVEQEFATASLNAANAALVQARAEAQRQQFYLERVVDPNLPDQPLLPHRFLNVLVIFAAAMCLYFVGWMFIIGILEHAPED